MSFLEDGYFTRAAVTSPLSGSTTNSLLQDADPGLFYLLNFYRDVIRLHIGARWNSEVALAGRSDLTDPVMDTCPYDPEPYFQENQFKFPLLAAYRTDEEYTWRSISYDSTACNINILWVLPPITAGQAERLLPFRAHVARTILDRTLNGFDTNLNDGQQPWKLAGLEEIQINSGKYGSYPDWKSDLYLPTLMIQGKLVERRNPDAQGAENFQGLTGIDIELDIQDQ